MCRLVKDARLTPEYIHMHFQSNVLDKDPISIIRKSRPMCAGGMETPNMHQQCRNLQYDEGGRSKKEEEEEEVIRTRGAV